MKKLELTAEEVQALIYTLSDVTEIYEDTDECDCEDEAEYIFIQEVAKALRTIKAKLEA